MKRLQDWLSDLRNNEVLLSPYTTMFVVIGMYAIKVFAKTGIGHMVHSPVLTGDGMHNASDIAEAVLVLLGIFIASLPKSRRYPYGRKNVEGICVLIIGVVLFGLCISIGLTSLVGLLAYWPEANTELRAIVPLPTHEPLLFAKKYCWLVAGVMGISFLMSLAVSRYQIYVGRKKGHASLEADGQETASDSKIELVAFVGIISEYVLNMPWLEYILGIIVACLILRTGRKLFLDGWHALLQHSIGLDHEEKISNITLQTEGIEEVKDIKTFMVGPIAVCNLLLITKTKDRSANILEKALRKKIKKYLKEEDFKGDDIWITFDQDEIPFKRVACAIKWDGREEHTAPCIAEATHLRVFAISNKKSDGRVTQEEMPRTLKEAVAMVKKKWVKTIYVFNGTEEEEQAFREAGIEYKNAPYLEPWAYPFYRF